MISWRLGELLGQLARHEPEIFERWFALHLDEMDSRYLTTPAPLGCEQHLTELPSAHRERLTRRYAGRPHIGMSMLRWLLGHDADLARRLLSDGTITVEDLLEILDGNQRMVDYFDDLGVRKPTLKTVAEAGRAHQVAPRDAAQSRERQARIRGR